METLARFALPGILAFSAVGALIVGVLLVRYSGVGLEDEEPDEIEHRIAAMRVAHALVAVCFAGVAILAVAALLTRPVATSRVAVTEPRAGTPAPGRRSGGGAAAAGSRVAGSRGLLRQRLGEHPLRAPRRQRRAAHSPSSATTASTRNSKLSTSAFARSQSPPASITFWATSDQFAAPQTAPTDNDASTTSAPGSPWRKASSAEASRTVTR